MHDHSMCHVTMRTRVDRTEARSCHVSVGGTFEGVTGEPAVLVILIILCASHFCHSKYCTKRLYLRPKLCGCHTVNFATKGYLLILALRLTDFGRATLLPETPLRLRLAPPSCLPK